MKRLRDMVTGVVVGITMILITSLIPNMDRAINGARDARAAAQIVHLTEQLDQVTAGLDMLLAAQIVEISTMQTLENLTPPAYRVLVAKAAGAHGMDPRLVAALVYTETGGRWDPTVIGTAGDTGLMQILPATAAWIGQQRGKAVPDLTDPAQNLDWGCWYLAVLVKEANGDPIEALRRYNAGPRWSSTAPTAAMRYSDHVFGLYSSKSQ